MRARETRRKPKPQPQPETPARPAAAGILALQRSAGNRAVAQVLARQRAPAAADLPATADTLRRYRAGLPRLRALAHTAAPPVGLDLAPALAWLRELVETLRLVESCADPSAFVFESVVVPGHDEEYGRAGADFKPQLEAALQAVVPIARATGTALRTTVVTATNASSIVADHRQADPQLPTLAQATSWREHATALAALAATVDRGGAGLGAAALACEDAALALLQARSVVEARATWRSAAAVSTPLADVPKPTRARNAVDDIFADSGFGTRQSLREDGTRDDWCGMFAAANMFRGAALDKNVRMAFAHTDNVHDFFTYNPSPTNASRTPVSIWAEGRWWGVREYHASRGLARTWIEGAGEQGADIRPGDIVLIRHTGAKPAAAIANHIVMVEAFDRAAGKLVTIEGNVIEGIHPDAVGDASRTATGELASTSTATSSTVVHIRDLNDRATTTPGGPGPGGAYQERGRPTIFGIGRPSLVDFESHDYGTLAVPERFQYTSPEEIRRRGVAVPLAPRSTIEAATAG